MEKYFTDERNVLVLLALLKAHNIKKVVASPGTTNITLIYSMQQDSWFEMYSSVDERSAAYLACGLAAESGEPVVLSCTGATASRNYMPGLTEAFYRKLPILAVTSTQDITRVGHHIAQVIDRSVLPNDVAKLSVNIPYIEDENNIWACEVNINKALLELKRYGGGPVHINLTTTYCTKYSIEKLPAVRVIDRICIGDKMPEISAKRIGVFVGSHVKWNKEQTEILDKFCAAYDAVVFCDHTSNFKGKYRVLYGLVAGQEQCRPVCSNLDLLIYIGEISGEYYSLAALKSKEVWRVSKDGELRDTFAQHRLRYVFEMSEQTFFNYYNKEITKASDSFLQDCRSTYDKIFTSIPDLPFSNIWIAYEMASQIPENSVIHFGILNSLRSWNFFEIPQSVMSSSNVGGFGIDGCISSLIGASLANKEKLYFGIVGDLAFFYDMNALGNRHVGNNLRIILVNNGRGIEFRNYSHLGAAFGEKADTYIAAAGHYGNKSRDLIKHYAEDLGFTYLCASNKDEFECVYKQFLTKETTSKPLLFEVFTNSEDESNALKMIRNIENDIKGSTVRFAKQILGEKGTNIIKKMMNS